MVALPENELLWELSAYALHRPFSPFRVNLSYWGKKRRQEFRFRNLDQI